MCGIIICFPFTPVALCFGARHNAKGDFHEVQKCFSRLLIKGVAVLVYLV